MVQRLRQMAVMLGSEVPEIRMEASGQGKRACFDLIPIHPGA